MIAPYFADTNVLVYAYDLDEPAKRGRARQIMSELGLRGDLSNFSISHGTHENRDIAVQKRAFFPSARAKWSVSR